MGLIILPLLAGFFVCLQGVAKTWEGGEERKGEREKREGGMEGPKECGEEG